MKILHFSERSSIPQDVYESERELIVSSYKELSDHNQLYHLLRSWRTFNDTDMFNLHLWIDVLNTLDRAMNDLLQVLKNDDDDTQSIVKENDSSSSGSSSSSSDSASYRATLRVILTWSTDFLKHSFNTNIYRSLDVRVTTVRTLMIACICTYLPYLLYGLCHLHYYNYYYYCYLVLSYHNHHLWSMSYRL